jgi:flagellar protein FliJ
MPQKKGFPLQPVLNFKSGKLDIIEIEFAQAKEAFRRETDILRRLLMTETKEMDALSQDQQKGELDCTSIQQRQHFLESVREWIERQTERVAEVQKQMEAKREELVKAMQDKNTLEKVRDRFKQEQAVELQKKETLMVDDIVTSRYARER